MNLFDATLDLASFAKGTEDYTITAVSGNTITCEHLSGRVAEFGGGTIWIRTGESKGEFGRIVSSTAQTLTLQNTYDLAIGNEITIGTWLEFDTQNLINAVNSVLRMYKILKVDSTTNYDPDTKVYDLPEGVTEDVRKVEMVTAVDTDEYTESHFWFVENGELHLYHRNRYLYEEDSPIRIWYVDYHGAVDENDTISSQVDPRYLRYMSWLYLCRHLIQQTHKDNLVSTDMYNEAKVYERDFGDLPNRSLGMRHFTYPQW